MLISYQNIQIRSICENEKEAIDRLGTKVALTLQSRLSDLDAADTVLDVLSGNPREVSFGVYRIDLVDNYFLEFKANHVSNPLLNEQKFDWSSITRIKIVQIEISYDSL